MYGRMTEYKIGGDAHKDKEQKYSPIVAVENLVEKDIHWRVNNPFGMIPGLAVPKHDNAQILLREDDYQGHNRQHAHWWESRLFLPADVVADEITWTQQELPNRNKEGRLKHAPFVQHQIADTVPRHSAHIPLLPASGTEMARENLATIVAMVAFVAFHVVNRLELPRFETLVSFSDAHSFDLMRRNCVLQETQLVHLRTTYLRICFNVLQTYFPFFIVFYICIVRVFELFGGFAPSIQKVEGCHRD